MRQEIEIYIKDTFNEEKTDILVRCFEVFEQYNLEDYDNQFIDLLMEVDYKDQYQAQLEFETLVKNNLLNLCYIQGVNLTDDTELSLICEITHCLLNIQHYEDKKAILDVIGTDFATEEKLCELFQLISPLNVERLLPAFEQVNPGIFVKLREVCAEDINLEHENPDKEEILNRLKILKQYLAKDDCIGFKLIKRSASIGLRFEHYFLYIKMKIDDMEIIDVAKELLVLFTMSSDTFRNVIEEFSKRSNNIFTDLDKISKVNSLLVKMCGEFDILFKTYTAEQKREQNAQA